MQMTAHLQPHYGTRKSCKLLPATWASTIQTVQKGHETAPNTKEVILTKMMHGAGDPQKFFKLVKLSAAI